jgi:hypothetical protein
VPASRDATARPLALGALMPAARITCAHLAVYSTMNLLNSTRDKGPRHAAKLGKSRLYFWVGKTSVDGVIELVEDFGRSAFWRTDAVVPTCSRPYLLVV